MVIKNVVIAVLAGAPLLVLAQPESGGHPADAAASVSAFVYRSVFSDYQPYRDEPRASWPRLHLELGPSLWGSGSQAVQKPAANAAEPERTPDPSTRRPADIPRGHSGHGR